MTVKISFAVEQDENNNRNLFAILDKGGNPDSDIRVKWAQLAMGYANELINTFPIPSLEHVEDTGAEIIFYQSDDNNDHDYNDDWDDDNDLQDKDDDWDDDNDLQDEDEDEDDDWDDDNDLQDEDDDWDDDDDLQDEEREGNNGSDASELSDAQQKMTIGFSLSVFNAHHRIGGLATPSVVVAFELMKLLKTARSKVIVK